MTDKILDLIAAKFPLTELDVGEFATVKAGGMKFRIRAFRADGLGTVSEMRAVGMLGLMKMDSVIIDPVVIDLPLYSYDRIKVMSNDVLITELYDTMISPFDETKLNDVKAEYAAIPERDAGEHWYDDIKLSSSISKKGKKKDSASIDALAIKHLTAYLSAPAPKIDESAKREKARYYVKGLLNNGGPSTDVFVKTLGKEKTEELFVKYLFGTDNV
jgi:hypothetical protein